MSSNSTCVIEVSAVLAHRSMESLKTIGILVMKTQFPANFLRLIALAGLAAAAPTSATSISRAEIIDNHLQISGSDAPPFAAIRWQGDLVGQADQTGAFEVQSANIPHRPQCSGTLVIGEWIEELPITVDNCRGTIGGYYVAPLDQRFVLPGDYAYVRSICEPGDYAISANQVISGGDGDPADFRVMDSSLLIDGSTGVQSWIVQGINAGANIADVRVAALCAQVNPPASVQTLGAVPAVPEKSVNAAPRVADR